MNVSGVSSNRQVINQVITVVVLRHIPIRGYIHRSIHDATFRLMPRVEVFLQRSAHISETHSLRFCIRHWP
jgi:hypothetical protein